VLLLTLVMVALVAAGTVGLTRTSLASATEAKRAERELQRRWAVTSCRRVLLEQAPTLIEQRWQASIETEDADDKIDALHTPLDRDNMRLVKGQVRLGGFTIDIRLADEQAKPNVNALLAEFDQEEASRLIDTLANAQSHRLPVELKPTKYDVQPTGDVQVRTLERVFKGFDPRLIFDERYSGGTSGGTSGGSSGGGGGGLPVDHVTCWGDRRLRLALACDEALRLLLSPYIDTTRMERLLELRNERPGITVDQAMRALLLGPAQSSPVRGLLADRSNCYSLWLTVRSEQRTWYELDIWQTQGPPEERHLTYLW